MANKDLKLRNLLREILMETFDEFANPYHIIVLIDEKDYPKAGQLNEGRWEPSGEKGYMQHIDQPHFDWQLLHIHLARDKHINTKNMQISWNNDGTRHDKKSFNNNFVGIETAKRIARNALGLPDNFQLEIFNVSEKAELILESIEYVPSKTSLFIFYVQNPNKSKLILS
jgi:Family of unknown function (DUF6367)